MRGTEGGKSWGNEPHTDENLNKMFDSEKLALHILGFNQLWIQNSIFDLQLGMRTCRCEDTVLNQ